MSSLQQALLTHGLYASHSIRLSADDREEFGFADQETGLLLVGNRGSSYWESFSGSAEISDDLPDPLDRWSKRVASGICADYPGFRPLFPSDGPPFLPFQRWAMAAEPLSASPLGLLIHPDYGLWHSFRFALVFDHRRDTVGELTGERQPSPCASCADKPCLHTCPVGAFTERGYDYLACADFLNSHADALCHQKGCKARNACPVGVEFQYQPAQHRFHLQAFLSAR